MTTLGPDSDYDDTKHSKVTPAMFGPHQPGLQETADSTVMNIISSVEISQYHFVAISCLNRDCPKRVL